MRRRHDRIGRQPVDLWLVQQQEERSEPSDAVVRIPAVQLRAVPAGLLKLVQAFVGALAELAELAELDRVGRARLRASRLVPALEAVVAERALPDAPVLSGSDPGGIGPQPWQVPLVEHAERTCRHAVAAPVADVLLHDDGAVLGAEERSRRADIETGGVRAVLADVG